MYLQNFYVIINQQGEIPACQPIMNILKKIRMERKKTQKQIANKLGITYQSYVRYETENLNPAGDLLISLAKIYGVSTDYLLGISEVENPASQTAGTGAGIAAPLEVVKPRDADGRAKQKVSIPALSLDRKAAACGQSELDEMETQLLDLFA